MANLVKISLSHRLRVKLYVETGCIIPNFIQEVIEIKPEQFELLKSINIDISENTIFDFTGNINSYYQKEWGVSHFTFNSNTLNINDAFEELMLTLSTFCDEVKFINQGIRIDKVKKSNREAYLNNYTEAIKLEGFNPTYFDSETIDYLERVMSITKN